MALARLTNKKYTVKNARNQQELAEYIQAVVRHTKDTNIDAVYNQLTFAYENIAAEFQVFVNSPIVYSTIFLFIHSLEVKKAVQFALHATFFDNNQSRQQHLQPQNSRTQDNKY